ncbi:polysaccharide biosynthesis protein [Priestia megaterium]|uniref:putative polysaccharide biosynthesis protein n=1 Tax=Priestia megaterium TaxID=1404 RepID=UPI002E2418B8|nr:polysaccharide biosynthesis protein [Priestia megaterium]
MSNSFLRGTFMLTIASFIVKIFGFIYVIPFVAMVGEEKYILFEYAYKPYIILLSIATLGIPSAVSKFVSKYREKGEFHIIRALMTSGSIVVTLMGITSFLVLYLGADTVASWLVDPSDKTGNSVQDVAYVIRMVSYALVIVPLLAMTRGFIQGYQEMGPTAISQIIEQIVRIAIILLGTYIIVVVMHGSPVKAVGLATFTAFISAVAALIVIFWYLRKKDFGIKGAKGKVSYKKLYKELVMYAIPFVFVGLAIPLFQSIDTFMINNVLMNKGYNLGQAELINTLVALIQKIIVIPVALATAFSVSLVAYVTKAHQGNRVDEIRGHINQSFKVMMIFVLPSTAGMLILSRPIYGSVFGTGYLEQGGTLMAWYAISALFYSMFSITSAVLQGLDQQKWVVYSLLIGLVVKVISNYPLILIFDGEGTAISTYVGFGVAIGIQMALIQKVGKYKWSENYVALKNVIKQTLVMAVTLIPLGIISYFFTSYISQAVILFVGLIIAGIVYCVLAYKNKTLFEVVSKNKVDGLLKKLKLA